jgi:hypothetical protein
VVSSKTYKNEKIFPVQIRGNFFFFSDHWTIVVPNKIKWKNFSDRCFYPTDVEVHLKASMTTTDDNVYYKGLSRHFVDLRDGTHGETAVTREEKEALFAEAVNYLAPYALQVLDEMNNWGIHLTGVATTCCVCGYGRLPE